MLPQYCSFAKHLRKTKLTLEVLDFAHRSSENISCNEEKKIILIKPLLFLKNSGVGF